MSPDTTLSADAVRSSRLAERLLVPAGFVTTAGNAFQITAAAILVFHAEQTTLAVGWLFIAVSIPQVALALLFGKLVDKVDRRMLCVAADLVSAMTAFALPVWLWIGGPANLGSYIANFMLACTAALFMPASNGLIKERIRDERLGKFNSHFEMASNAGMLLASSLAGFLVIWFGATPLFIFNSLTFIVSAVLVYAIGRKPAKAPVVEETVIDPSAPVEAPVRQPIKRLALLYANGNIGLMVANVILTTLILQTFGQGAWMIGVVDALAGVGFIVGAAMYGKVSKRFKGIHLAVLGTLGNLICLAIQPLHYIALMAAIPFAGFCFAQGRIAARTLLMRASPEERVGRIFGGTQAVGLGLGVGATVGLSTLADAFSVPYAFWGLAILQGAIVIGTYFSLAKPLSAQEKKQPVEVLEATAA
ncbi:MFS transporter [Amycolatopsis pittospori]|uniref:MFS transporter n=1 Tax=Amycolatopsis pittospori TaxID=2749434 RepID=UPI0015F08615|nr:MFS transporter [Amycolatopsis pittospori]